MFNLTLPILHHTDETRSLKAIDIDYQLADCEIRQMTFYSINATSEYKDESIDHGLTSVFSNGSEFICNLPKDEVDNLIAKCYGTL